jgi:GH25 family lysozyme M1 (1,4-beta-N-acetylmuramidase)
MASVPVVQGLDVSKWQGAFGWRAWTGKIGFGLAKAVEGDAETDPEFGYNWDAMWWMQAGHRFPRFAYLYFHASLDPVVQAAHLVATVRGHGLLPGDNFVFDFEATADDGLNDGVPPPVAAARARECLQHVNALAPGHRVLPYMNPSFAAAGHSEGMDAWRLWLADYGVPAPTAPQPWDRATFWQYTDEPIDGDRFLGTEAELLAFCRMPDSR